MDVFIHISTVERSSITGLAYNQKAAHKLHTGCDVSLKCQQYRIGLSLLG